MHRVNQAVTPLMSHDRARCRARLLHACGTPLAEHGSEMTDPVAFIVDDDREFRARVCISLRRNGFRVRTFSGARAAFAKVISVLARAISAVPRRVILL